MLIDAIKKQMLQALKAGRVTEKEVLRVALGEMQTAEARGEPMGDAEAQGVIKRLIKANEETMKVTADEAQRAVLADEIAILRALLPATLGVDQIVAALASVREQVRAAPNDGAATGVAMKHLKAAGAQVTGPDVAAAVRALRG